MLRIGQTAVFAWGQPPRYLAVLAAAGLEGEGFQGRFKVGNTKVAAFALIAMLTGVCNWYKPGGALSRSDLIKTHTAMALKGIMAA